MIQVAIANDGLSVRCFYIAEGDPLCAMRLLHKAVPNLGHDVQLSPVTEAAAKVLGMKPGDVTEWHIGQTTHAESLLDAGKP